MRVTVFFIFLVSLMSIYEKTYADEKILTDIKLPVFDIMTGMKVQWVAEKIIYNGHPMSIQSYLSIRNAKDVMRYFESKWKIKGLGELKYNTVGKDYTIGFVNNAYSYSVQARDAPGGSKGTLVITRNKAIKQSKTKFPMLPDGYILSRIHSIDIGIKSETITVSSYRSAQMSKQWYRSKMLRNGWIAQPSVIKKTNAILEFQKGKELCQLTFIGKSPVREHNSMVMIHWIKG